MFPFPSRFDRFANFFFLVREAGSVSSYTTRCPVSTVLSRRVFVTGVQRILPAKWGESRPIEMDGD